MVADPLSTAWAKYNWASKHLQAVDAALQRSLDPKVHSIAFEVEVESQGPVPRATVRIARLPIIRTDVGLTLGDVIHNFRASLDHLAWGLVRAGSDPRPQKPRKVYFPMATSWGEFKGRIDSWLPGVSDDHRALIRRYQPYRRGEGPKAIRWLNKFSNMDKHRVLIPAVVNHSRIECSLISNWPIRQWEWLARQPRALHVGTPVTRVLLDRGTSDCKVKVQGRATLHPSLGYGVPVIDALMLIRSTIFEILAGAEKLL